MVAKPERDIIGELNIAEEDRHILTGIDMMRAAPVEYPVDTFGEHAGIAHLFCAGSDLVIERELCIFKDGWTDPEKVIHQVGMHFCLFDKFPFVAKTAGDAMVVGLPQQLGIPVTGNLVKEGQDIRLPLLQLLNKRSGKRECAVKSLFKFFENNPGGRHVALFRHPIQYFVVQFIKIKRVQILFLLLWIR